MSLAVAWQFLNAARESDEIAKIVKTFLLLAPNVIVLERLKTDFVSGRIFRSDPVIPRELEIFWEFDCVMRGEARSPADRNAVSYQYPPALRVARPGVDTAERSGRPQGKKPAKDLGAGGRSRADQVAPDLVVLNDEAHHTHDEEASGTRLFARYTQRLPSPHSSTFPQLPDFRRVPFSLDDLRLPARSKPFSTALLNAR